MHDIDTLLSEPCGDLGDGAHPPGIGRQPAMTLDATTEGRQWIHQDVLGTDFDRELAQRGELRHFGERIAE
ncbi:hypothetical protein Acor_21500 [Acrocarpospora corrugata]|uniref:Uncharacterized protein n=1 Tax=Acrocarpospora corrugata TaxID=35763 RepID=A0A5M3VTF8_9ACTN|nr:hypothetical protein Acor_21500 [Acrocarpospora corrugata]